MVTLPTISQLYAQVISDLNSEYGATINPFGKAVLRVFAGVQAAKLKLYYVLLAAIQKNVAPDSCDEETLIRFGKIKLNRLPFAAIAGQYSVLVTGTIGQTIPAQTTFKSDDDSTSPGILYVLDTLFTFSSGTGTITLRALTLGVEGKLDISDTLTSTAPLPQIESLATVTAEIVEPLAAETIEDYREKVLQAYRLEPQGGAATDYRLWASDAQGVEKVYPYARSGYPCEINLYIEATVADSIDGLGTPSPSLIDDVEDVINFDPDTSLPLNERGRRPLQVIVNYFPITPRPVVITISSFSGLTVDIQNRITSEIEKLLTAIRPFVDSADVVSSKNDILDGNKLIASILTASPGATFGSVSFTVSGTPYSTYTFIEGDIPYKSLISYV